VVELSHADGAGFIYRVTVSVAADVSAADVRLALVKALTEAGILLGRARGLSVAP
jgi:hypothetical protein